MSIKKLECGSGSGRSSSGKERKKREAVDKVKTVDNREQIREGKWCDHVKAEGTWFLGSDRPTICVFTPDIRIVIEQGTVKILCPACYLKAVQLPMFV
jgi:hypothetical protein